MKQKAPQLSEAFIEREMVLFSSTPDRIRTYDLMLRRYALRFHKSTYYDTYAIGSAIVSVISVSVFPILASFTYDVTIVGKSCATRLRFIFE